MPLRLTKYFFYDLDNSSPPKSYYPFQGVRSLCPAWRQRDHGIPWESVPGHCSHRWVSTRVGNLQAPLQQWRHGLLWMQRISRCISKPWWIRRWCRRWNRLWRLGPGSAIWCLRLGEILHFPRPCWNCHYRVCSLPWEIYQSRWKRECGQCPRCGEGMGAVWDYGTWLERAMGVVKLNYRIRPGCGELPGNAKLASW